jgi:imidazolonepropionase-like amidohydrolase
MAPRGSSANRPVRATPRPTTGAFVLREAMILDQSGGFRGPCDVAVDDGVVVATGRNIARGSTHEYDFRGLWLMPGMFDCHVHVVATSLDTMELLRTPLSERVLEAGSILERILRAGVTYARDAGGADAGIKRAIDRGYVHGPHLQIAVTPISQTGGHFDGFIAGPGWDSSAGYQFPDFPGRPPILVDGVEEMRKAVRMRLRAGADWIKLTTTGGIMSAYGSGTSPELSYDEIATAVHEAGRKSKHVMVHCFGGPALTDSVLAGVRSIEHGFFLTEADARLMAARGCWLVPTLSILRDVRRWAEAGRLPLYAAKKIKDLGVQLGDSVKVAREYGVKIALGTDFISREQHGHNLGEIALAADAGLTPQEALLAATRNGADLLGVGDRYGRIEPGCVFDALVLDKDPSNLEFARTGSIAGVFKAGSPVVRHPRMGSGD